MKWRIPISIPSPSDSSSNSKGKTGVSLAPVHPGHVRRTWRQPVFRDSRQPPGQPAHGGAAIACRWLQFAEQPQDQGGHRLAFLFSGRPGGWAAGIGLAEIDAADESDAAVAHQQPAVVAVVEQPFLFKLAASGGRQVHPELPSRRTTVKVSDPVETPGFEEPSAAPACCFGWPVEGPISGANGMCGVVLVVPPDRE